jgi:hypothetical protein
MVFINNDAATSLKFIGSFYWLYKALNTHYEYKSTVHVHVKVIYCKMCIFVVWCVIYLYRCYSYIFVSILKADQRDE